MNNENVFYYRKYCDRFRSTHPAMNLLERIHEDLGDILGPVDVNFIEPATAGSHDYKSSDNIAGECREGNPPVLFIKLNPLRIMVQALAHEYWWATEGRKVSIEKRKKDADDFAVRIVKNAKKYYHSEFEDAKRLTQQWIQDRGNNTPMFQAGI